MRALSGIAMAQRVRLWLTSGVMAISLADVDHALADLCDPRPAAELAAAKRSFLAEHLFSTRDRIMHRHRIPSCRGIATAATPTPEAASLRHCPRPPGYGRSPHEGQGALDAGPRRIGAAGHSLFVCIRGSIYCLLRTGTAVAPGDQWQKAGTSDAHKCTMTVPWNGQNRLTATGGHTA